MKIQAGILFILCFMAANSVAQTEKTRVFFIDTFSKGELMHRESDTVKTNEEKSDIYFFQKHFQSLPFIPGKLTDTSQANKKNSEWQDPDAEDRIYSNWEYSYTYDSLGRMVNYSYSGCFICSNMPYNYNIIYNSAGQIEQIVSIFENSETFKLYYSNQGDLIQVEQYYAGSLVREIRLRE